MINNYIAYRCATYFRGSAVCVFSQLCSQCGHEAWKALVRFLMFLMLMEFVYFFYCFFSLFCYVTRHDDIVIRIKLHVFPTVYTRVTYSTVTSRVNGASANDQKKVIDNVIHEISWLIWAILFFFNFAGNENDVNHVLSMFVDSEHEVVNFHNSRYIGMSDIKSVFQWFPYHFTQSTKYQCEIW